MNIEEKFEDGYVEFFIEDKAKLCFHIFYDYEEYFDEDLNPEERREFFKLTEYEPLVLLEHLEVKPEYRGKGLSSILMNYFNNYVRNNNYKFVYLNASPCMDRGLELDDLTEFYKRRGFRILKDQVSNRLMIKKVL